MAQQPTASRRNCPHCGKPTGLPLLALLPAPNTDDDFTCRACKGHFKLSERTRLWCLGGGLIPVLPAIYLFAHFTPGRGGAVTAAAGLVVVLLAFGLGSIGFGWLMLSLEPKR
jgi:hypothetical protein